VIDYGPAALLLETEDAQDALGLYRAVLATDLPNLEAVPAARTVLVRFPNAGACRTARPLLSDLAPLTVEAAATREVTIPVVYDGDDLREVAELTGLSVEEVIARHTASVFDVAFVGFAPGFGYFTGLDPRLHVPRLDSPRTSVPAGSVAIAGSYAAVYPTASPGGWRLLGRTSILVFDVDRDPPALFEPGVHVRFTAVTS
jgi:KipI family sensor histidine kinase inhibitor